MFVTPKILISERPAEAEDRAVPGHWEGDLILGLDSSAIGAPPGSRCCCTPPPMECHGELRVKNGPPLAGHGAEAVRDAIASSITTLPGQLRRSLTWDQGAEMASTPSCASTPASTCTSATLTVPGSAAATRSPTVCCASTSRGAPT